MRKWFRLPLLLVCCFVVVAQPLWAETLTVRSDIWPPYNGEPNTPQQGYMIVTLMEIFKPHGITIDYQTMPWEDSLDAVRIVVGAAKDDAPDFYFPAETFGKSDTGFFVKRNSDWKYSGIASLSEVKLGVITDYSYNEELDNYLEANAGSSRIYLAAGENPLPELIALLQNGKIDVIAEDSNVMLSTLINCSVTPGAIVPAGRHSEITDVYVAFSPNNPRSPAYAKIFDEGIRDLRKRGKLDKILFLYGLKDWLK